MAQGLLNNGVSITKNFSDYEYETLVDYEVTSSTTSITFNGFELEEDSEYVLVSDINNSTGSSCNISLYVNNNITDTNYYVQRLYAQSTSIGSARSNCSYFSQPIDNSKAYQKTKIKLTNNGYFTAQTNSTSRYVPTSTQLIIDDWYMTSTFTIPSITSLTITSSGSNGIGIGSRFQLYKVKGQVQQTWATT